MKNYRITVNGVAYDVAVEELGAGEASAAPVSTPAAVPAPAKKAAPKTSGSAGAVKITAPMPGKIVAVKAQAGASVKKGDAVLVLEAMKMENEICAAQDGVIASVEVAVGDMVEGGDVLAKIKRRKIYELCCRDNDESRSTDRICILKAR